MVEALSKAGVELLDIATPHVLAVTASPLSHHDPFDRLITAQAHVEGALLFTADRKILSANLPFVIDARQ